MQATDLDEIIKAHSLYMEKILERCLITIKVKFDKRMDTSEIDTSEWSARKSFVSLAYFLLLL